MIQYRSKHHKLSYIIIWTCKTQSQRVQNIQNSAAKVALGGTKFDHVTPDLLEHKCLNTKATNTTS